MSIFGIFVLTTAIGMEVSRSPASETHDAYQALVKATYIQMGVDKQMKSLEKKYVPLIVKEYGGWITGITKIVSDKKISFEWTF